MMPAAIGPGSPSTAQPVARARPATKPKPTMMRNTAARSAGAASDHTTSGNHEAKAAEIARKLFRSRGDTTSAASAPNSPAIPSIPPNAPTKPATSGSSSTAPTIAWKARRSARVIERLLRGEQPPREQVYEPGAHQRNRERGREAGRERREAEAPEPAEAGREADGRHRDGEAGGRGAGRGADRGRPERTVDQRRRGQRGAVAERAECRERGEADDEERHQPRADRCPPPPVPQRDQRHHGEQEQVADELRERRGAERLGGAVELRVEEARRSHLRGVVDRGAEEEAGEPRVGAEPVMRHEGMYEQREQTEQRDRADGVAGLVLAGADQGRGGRDRGVAADRRADGDEEPEPAREAEGARRGGGEQERRRDAGGRDRQRGRADLAERPDAQADAQ